MRSGGPVPKFSPRMVTLVHATPSLGEMPVTNGGWRARDIVAWGMQKRWAGQRLEKFTKNLFKFEASKLKKEVKNYNHISIHR